MKLLILLLALVLVLIPLSFNDVFAQVEHTKGNNYDLVEDFNIGEATWQSHPDRISMNGQWENYVLTDTTDKIIFNSNAVGTFIYDKDSCSYSIYDRGTNGFNGAQVIPSVSAVATFQNNGQWQNLSVNDQSCEVSVSQYEDGVFLTSTKVVTQDTIEDIFIPISEELFYGNSTLSEFTFVTRNNDTGYYDGMITTTGIVIDKFVQELDLNIYKGFKETFKVWHDGDEALGISQTVHTGESITIGEQTINIAQLNGQSFDKQYIEANEAEILQLTDSVNYDFDTGIKSLTNVNIIFDDTYKVNLDYANGNDGVPFVNYLEIDPTVSITSTQERWRSDATNVSRSDADDYYSYKVLDRKTVVWDLSSISSSQTVTSATFSAQTTPYFGSQSSCQIVGLPSNPDTYGTNISGYLADIISGTVYVTSSGFCGSGTFTDTFTSAGTTAMTNALGGDFHMSFKSTGSAGSNNGHYGINSGSHRTLAITHPLPTAPDPPTSLATVAGIPIAISWTAPVDDGGSSVTGYKLFRTINEYALSDLPNSSGSDNQLTFTDNELLVHGFPISDSSTNSISITSTGTTTTGTLGTAIQDPVLTFTNTNLPDNTDELSVGGWVKLDELGAVITTTTEADTEDITRTSAWYGSGMYVKPDGTKLWTYSINGGINEYALSTAGDLTTISQVGSTFTTATADTKGIEFNDVGTKMFLAKVVNNAGHPSTIQEWALGTAYDLSSASGSQTGQTDIASDGTGNTGQYFGALNEMRFSTDGMFMFLSDNAGHIFRHDLTTAYTPVDNLTQELDVPNNTSGSPSGHVFGFQFSADGKSLFTGAYGDIYHHSLSTAWDLTSTVTLVGSLTPSVNQSTHQGGRQAISFSNDETRMWTFDQGSGQGGSGGLDTIFQYNTQAGLGDTKLLGINNAVFNIGKTTASVTGQDGSIISATGLTDNTSTVQHYAVTRDSSNGWIIYQNGVSRVTNTTSTSLGSNTGQNYSTDIDGTLDEFFINSDLLSASEIDSIFDRGTGTALLTSPTPASYSDSAVVGGTTYYYSVQAVNSVGSSDSTSTVSGLAGVAPNPPTGVSASITNTATAPLVVTVNFSPSGTVGTGTVTGFQLLRDGVAVTTGGLVTTLSDTAPSGGTSYSYTVKALGTHGNSVASSASAVTTPNSPAQVTGLTVTPVSTSRIDLSWNTPSDNNSLISSYKVQISSNGGSSWSDVLTGNVNTTYQSLSLTTNSQYHYKVSAINGVGAGTASAISNTYTMTPTPSSLSATPVSEVQINLSWGASTGATGYKVEYESPTGNGFTTHTANTGNTDLTKSITSLTTATQYNFRVSGINAGGASVASPEASSYTWGILSAPTLDTITRLTSTSLKLDFTAGAGLPVATGYKIERQTGSGWIELIANTASTDVTFTDTVLSSDQTATYRLYAINNIGTSPVSNERTSDAIASSGGGGSSNKAVSSQTGITGLIDLTFIDQIHRVILGEFLSKSINVAWDSSENIEVKSIIVSDSPFRIVFQDVPFVLIGDPSGISNGKINYSVQIPNDLCNTQGQINCVEQRQYDIPVEIQTVHKSSTLTKSSVIKIDLAGGSDIPLVFVLLAIGAVPLAFIIRKVGSGKSKRKASGSSHKSSKNGSNSKKMSL